VQREALARQGLARFWDVDVPDPKKPRNVSYKLKPDTKMVVFWPDYSRSNPYQKLLYGKMRQHTEVVAGEIDAAMKVIDSQAALPAEVTFHLHWLNFLFKPDADEATTRATVDAFLSKIEKFVWKGGRLVWTIHNTLSHDTAFPEIERDLSVRLAAVAHDLHFHSAASVAEVAETFDLPRDKVRISRHGNYIGAYADYVSRAEARAAMGIGADDDVILFTGQIRPYKGVEDLVLAFRRILADRPQARLLLAGRPSFDPLESISPALTEAERSRILSTGRFVESGEWQLFLRAADIAAYPYQKILTSGSLLLALSFGVPAIIPQVGMTKEVLDGRQAGRLYDGSGGAEALEAALRDLLSAKDEGRLDQMSRNARSLAEELDWPDFAATVTA
jgi:O-antigen biosynthesis protein